MLAELTWQRKREMKEGERKTETNEAFGKKQDSAAEGKRRERWGERERERGRGTLSLSMSVCVHVCACVCVCVCEREREREERETEREMCVCVCVHACVSVSLSPCTYWHGSGVQHTGQTLNHLNSTTVLAPELSGLAPRCVTMLVTLECVPQIELDDGGLLCSSGSRHVGLWSIPYPHGCHHYSIGLACVPSVPPACSKPWA
jgi:hypothetical protein